MPNSPLFRRSRSGLPLALTLALAGCATGPPPDAAANAAPAEVRLENLTARAWDITLTAKAGGIVRTERIPPRGTRLCAVSGGSYVVEQRLLAVGEDRAEAVRSLEVSFRPGARYRWPLATLAAEAIAEINSGIRPP